MEGFNGFPGKDRKFVLIRGSELGNDGIFEGDGFLREENVEVHIGEGDGDGSGG